MKKSKFLSNFIDFLKMMAVDIPNIFIDAHPLYRALKRKNLSKKKVTQGMYNLAHRGYVRKNSKGFILTNRGIKWLELSKLKYFRLRNEPWDRKWHLILFDIPSGLQSRRHKLRSKLRSMGAYMIQKSVFAFPYYCEQEIGQLCNELGITDHVEVLVTDCIGSKEQYVRQHFNL